MVSVGRSFCVALPVLLTIASIVALLIPMLAGAAHQNMALFQINMTDAKIEQSQLKQLGDIVGINFRRDDRTITATDFGLADTYDVTLWGYCRTKNGKKECTKSQFDWASKTLNDSVINDFGAPVGISGVKLPKDVADAIRAFRVVFKITEIAFIAAAVALGIELIVGVFAVFSRAISCLVWLEAITATGLVISASTLATVVATIVIGAIKGTAGTFNITAKIYTNFLIAIWLSAAFALAAIVFWIATVCCCKPERRVKHKDNYDDGEKLLPTRGYKPLSHEHDNGGFYQPNPYENQHQQQHNNQHEQYPPRYPSGHGRADLAYEPYSHRA